MREFIISTDSTNDLPETYLKENNIAVWKIKVLYYLNARSMRERRAFYYADRR